jgi:hypothetical protein
MAAQRQCRQQTLLLHKITAEGDECDQKDGCDAELHRHGKMCAPAVILPTFRQHWEAIQQRKACDSEQHPEDSASARMHERGEIDSAKHGNHAEEVDLLATVDACAVTPFADEPYWYEKQRTYLLKLVTQKPPANTSAYGPEHNSGRPVLIHVEDLPDRETFR